LEGCQIKNDCFILCTGSSLLSLSDKEKKHINKSPHICVNRFPVFWKILGIKPKDYIFLDDNQSVEIIERIVTNNDSMNIITSLKNQMIFEKSIKSLNPSFLSRYTIFNHTRNRKHFIDSIDSNLSLFWSSILGSAVNYYTIIHPDRNIKILGMDGKKSVHFWTNKCKDTLDHSCVNQEHNSVGMLKWGIPIIIRECQKRSINVYSCSHDSYWVKNKYIPYSKVLS